MDDPRIGSISRRCSRRTADGGAGLTKSETANRASGGLALPDKVQGNSGDGSCPAQNRLLRGSLNTRTNKADPLVTSVLNC